MEQIEMQSQKAGKRTARKNSTQMDFTPMVDLGFLLIAFFMLTAAFTRLNALTVTYPADGPPTPMPQSSVVSLLLAGNNQLFYYTGNDITGLHKMGFANNSIRQLLLTEKQKRVNPDPKKQLTVLIKPGEQSRYQNLIDIIDEMKICGIGSYTIADISAKEQQKINQFNNQQNK